MSQVGSMSGKPTDFRSNVVRVMTFLGGIYFFLYFITPEGVLRHLGVVAAHESISNGFIAVGAMAIGLGIINVVVSHGSKLVFRKQGWFYSATLLVGLFATIWVTFAQWFHQREIAQDVRRLQIAGEFATRIVSDAKNSPDTPKSFSPDREIPPLAARIEALRRYADHELVLVDSEISSLGSAEAYESSLDALLAEARQASAALRASEQELGQHSWREMDGQAELSLTRISSSAAKLASAYALLRRSADKSSSISRLYSFVYNGLFNNLGSAMFALLGVYIAAAAYRAFRIQSLESGLMMGAALVVMLGQISFGRIIYEDMPALRQWLLEVPNA